MIYVVNLASNAICEYGTIAPHTNLPDECSQRMLFFDGPIQGTSYAYARNLHQYRQVVAKRDGEALASRTYLGIEKTKRETASNTMDKKEIYNVCVAVLNGQYGGRTRDLGVNQMVLAPRSNQLS